MAFPSTTIGSEIFSLLHPLMDEVWVFRVNTN
jgi:hypothetical protein